MISGAHVVLYSRDADADRAFLRDAFDLPGVDVGAGWLILGLPPAEIAVHPAEANDLHEVYLLCDDIDAFAAAMQDRGVDVSEVHNEPWGRLVAVPLPGGGEIGVYQPLHERPDNPPAR
ncbi:MAG: hypothetical protein R3181_11700 [Rubricoccaceae bacterium]|nr:hypothetical protein [Rubricoccaceae bacterium]